MTWKANFDSEKAETGIMRTRCNAKLWIAWKFKRSALSQRWVILCMTTRAKLPLAFFRGVFFFCSSDNCSLCGEILHKETFPDANVYAKLMIRYGAWMFACDLLKLYVAILSFVGLWIVALSLPSNLRTCLKLWSCRRFQVSLRRISLLGIQINSWHPICLCTDSNQTIDIS